MRLEYSDNEAEREEVLTTVTVVAYDRHPVVSSKDVTCFVIVVEGIEKVFSFFDNGVNDNDTIHIFL